ALQSNPGVRAALENLLRANDHVVEVKSAVLPHLTASGSYTIQGPLISFPIQVGNRTETIQVNRGTVGQAQITGTLDTDLAGRQAAQRHIAQSGVRQAQGAVNQTVNDLVANVENAYLETLRNQALVSVAGDAVAAAQE